MGYWMTHRVLLAGCSFIAIETQEPMPPWDEINYQKYIFRGTPAAGNVAIAQRVQYEVVRQPWEHVVILWSGINRIDIPKTQHQHNEMPHTYPFILELGDMYWYLSGGICGSWYASKQCPEPVYTQFMQAFINQTPRTASDTTFEAIVDTQQFLEKRNIPYTMSFIYDINRDYNSELDIFGNRFARDIAKDRWPHWLALEHCLGQADVESEWYSQIDWTKFPAIETPFEYCASRNMLQADRFHPTKDGLKQWFKHQLDIYLTDS